METTKSIFDEILLNTFGTNNVWDIPFRQICKISHNKKLFIGPFQIISKEERI